MIFTISLSSSYGKLTKVMSEMEKNLMKENLAMFEKYAIYYQKKHYKDSLQRKNAQLEFEIIKMIIRSTLKKPTAHEIKKANKMLKMVYKNFKFKL